MNEQKSMTCNRCGKEIENGEIHLSRGGEERRLTIEQIFKTKVSQCSNPPPSEYWIGKIKNVEERDYGGI